MNKQKLIFSRTSLWVSVIKVLGWMRSEFYTPKATGPMSDYLYLISHLKKIQSSRGPEASFAYAKLARGALLGYLSGNPERFEGIRCTKDGIPLCLGPLIQKVREASSPVILQMILTILYAPRALNLGKVPDFHPITEPPLGSISNIGMFAGSFWRDLGYTLSGGSIPRSLLWKSFHFSTKAGPQGHALLSSMSDLDLLLSTYPDLLQDIKTVGGSKLTAAISSFEGVPNYVSQLLYTPRKSYWDVFQNVLSAKGYPRLEVASSLRSKDVNMEVTEHSLGLWSSLSLVYFGLRRVVWFPDKEMKVRVIAILDYWSQTALRPLHSYLFKLLKKIPQDCTFDQRGFKEKLINSGNYNSIDLSNATDRFPIELICLILKAHLPHHYVDAWKNIMVKLPFDITQTCKGTEVPSSVSYGAGNPMGAYSSWATFAVAHHYIVYYCCKVLGKKWNSLPYALLGDDIVIGDDEVASMYLEVLKTLGVKVSPLKTHRSPHLYEFAKRLIYKGEEITPFPISALRESCKISYLMVNLLVESENKGFKTTKGIPDALASFYGRTMDAPSVLRRRIRDSSASCELIMRIMRDTSRASTLINEFLGRWSYPLPQLNQEVCLNILSNIAVGLFAESHESLLRPSARNLGLLAEELVMGLTGIEDPKAIDQINNPFLRSYGLIEEKYVNQIKESFRLDTQGEAWPVMVRALTIPLDDKVFVEKKKNTRSKASAIFGKQFLHQLEVLKRYPQLLEF
uniref:RNA dependent RNA polymerase n=1 Tax=Heilongjiang mito-like virus 10 TaxID=2937085 RepID=A0A9Y1CSQ8_9VIRU|nr:MAG: putative RNA dependent RNA polymerase [Heilongjiang mito-like virus 10]